MHVNMLRLHATTCAFLSADELRHLKNILLDTGNMEHSRLTLFDKKKNRICVITRVKPIAGTKRDIVTFFLHMNRKRFTTEGCFYRFRNKLFWMLPLSEVVHRPRD